jgi:hypothetical protein
MSHQECGDQNVICSSSSATKNLVDTQSCLGGYTQKVGVVFSPNDTGNVGPVTVAIHRIIIGNWGIVPSIIITNKIGSECYFVARSKAASESRKCIINAALIRSLNFFQENMDSPGIDFSNDNSTAIKTFFVKFIHTAGLMSVEKYQRLS